MKTQRLLFALTFVNLGLLTFSLTHLRPVEAQGIAPVLRGRSLEIVDEKGRPRATISVLPGDPAFKMPDGTVGYTETVLLRLINSKGRPNVKIDATEVGADVGLGGEADPTYVAMRAKGRNTLLTMTDKDGKQQLIKP